MEGCYVYVLIYGPQPQPADSPQEEPPRYLWLSGCSCCVVLCCMSKAYTDGFLPEQGYG